MGPGLIALLVMTLLIASILTAQWIAVAICILFGIIFALFITFKRGIVIRSSIEESLSSNSRLRLKPFRDAQSELEKVLSLDRSSSTKVVSHEAIEEVKSLRTMVSELLKKRDELDRLSRASEALSGKSFDAKEQLSQLDQQIDRTTDEMKATVSQLLQSMVNSRLPEFEVSHYSDSLARLKSLQSSLEESRLTLNE